MVSTMYILFREDRSPKAKVTHIVLIVLTTLGARETTSTTQGTKVGHATSATSQGTQVGHALAAHAAHAAELGEVNVAQATALAAALATKATEVVGIVILGGLVLLILIDPL